MKGQTIGAVTQPRGRRAIREDMSQMTVTASTMYLHPHHAKTAVLTLAHRPGYGPEEGRPA